MGGVVGGTRFRMDVNGSMAKRMIWECQSGKYRGGEEAAGKSRRGGSGNQRGRRTDE